MEVQAKCIAASMASSNCRMPKFWIEISSQSNLPSILLGWFRGATTLEDYQIHIFGTNVAYLNGKPFVSDGVKAMAIEGSVENAVSRIQKLWQNMSHIFLSSAFVTGEGEESNTTISQVRSHQTPKLEQKWKFYAQFFRKMSGTNNMGICFWPSLAIQKV